MAERSVKERERSMRFLVDYNDPTTKVGSSVRRIDNWKDHQYGTQAFWTRLSAADPSQYDTRVIQQRNSLLVAGRLAASQQRKPRFTTRQRSSAFNHQKIEPIWPTARYKGEIARMQRSKIQQTSDSPR